MVSVSLSKRGFSSKTPQAVAFGPRRLLGIGDRHLHHEQGIGATLQFLKHIRSSSQLGTFLQIGLDWTQPHAGVSFPILENTTRPLPHLEKGWFPCMRDFLGSVKASIHTPTTVLPTLLRVHDSVIIEDLLANDFTPGQCTKINMCRLCLQVECLSEICNPTGDCLLDRVWRGERSLSKSNFLEIPLQEQLPMAPTSQAPRSLMETLASLPSSRASRSLETDGQLPQHQPVA
jgi:hypothetical protein